MTAPRPSAERIGQVLIGGHKVCAADTEAVSRLIRGAHERENALRAEIDTLRGERDEARAEVERLRVQMARTADQLRDILALVRGRAIEDGPDVRHWRLVASRMSALARVADPPLTQEEREMVERYFPSDAHAGPSGVRLLNEEER